MLTSNPTFKGLMKVYQIPTKPVPRSYNETNFQEFRKVYCEEKDPIKCFVKKPLSVRPKTDLKTIQLEMPILGSEKAILSVPVLKKNALKKSILRKKPSYTATNSSTHELIRKLSKIEKKQLKRGNPSKELKTSSTNLIEKTNKEIEISAVQLQQIQELIKKKQKLPQKHNSPIYKLNKKNSPRIRHFDCLNSKYHSTLSSLQKKVTYLENKYFSKPQIVYKSIHDNFTQSSDIKILYENKAYPEDLKMDQALRGIINELDDMVKVNMEEKLLGTNSFNSKLLTSSVESAEINESRILPNESTFSTDSENTCNDDKTIFSTNLDNLFKFGRQVTLGKFKSKKTIIAVNNLLENVDNTPKRDFVSKVSQKDEEVNVSTSLSNTKFGAGKLNQRPKKKVTFVDTILEETPLIPKPQNDNRKDNINISKEKYECEDIVDKMYRASLSSFDEPASREDSIFSLLDDTKTQLDEFLQLKHDMERVENGKFLFQNTINDMEHFVKTKQRFDQRKKVVEQIDTQALEIIERIKGVQGESGTSKSSNFANTEDSIREFVLQDKVKNGIKSLGREQSNQDEISTRNDISNIIDSSEALVKKFRSTRNNLLSVGEFCDNLSRIAESELEEDEDRPNEKPFNLHEGSGDENDSLEIDEDDLTNSIKKSSFLMKEFNLLPKVNFFSQSDSAVSSKDRNRHEVHTTANRGVDMRTLKRNVNYALKNSIFGTLEY